MLILICDDKNTRLSVAGKLEEAGEEVTSFSSGNDLLNCEADIIVFVNGDDVFESTEGIPVRYYTDEDIRGLKENARSHSIPGLIADSVIEEVKYCREMKKSENLMEAIKGCDKGLNIFLHDNPDPDAIASGMALARLCDHAGTRSTIYYSGSIGYPENQLFVKTMGVDMKKLSKDHIENIMQKGRETAFVDFARPGVNNILPRETKAKIIIDHHYTNKDLDDGDYVEIKTVGATSTLMTKHIQRLGLDIEATLATALFYGIKVDTSDYTRNMGPMDFEAISHLLSRTDKDILDLLEATPMEPDTVDALGRAITNRNVHDGVMTSFAGEVLKRDDIPQVADLLEGEKDISTVLIYGIYDGHIHLSARSKDPYINLGKVMERAYSSLGSAGGHLHSAGGKIDISNFDSLGEAHEEIDKKFREEVIKG